MQAIELKNIPICVCICTCVCVCVGRINPIFPLLNYSNGHETFFNTLFISLLKSIQSVHSVRTTTILKRSVRSESVVKRSIKSKKDSCTVETHNSDLFHHCSVLICVCSYNQTLTRVSIEIIEFSNSMNTNFVCSFFPFVRRRVFFFFFSFASATCCVLCIQVRWISVAFTTIKYLWNSSRLAQRRNSTHHDKNKYKPRWDQYMMGFCISSS